MRDTDSNMTYEQKAATNFDKKQKKIEIFKLKQNVFGVSPTHFYRPLSNKNNIDFYIVPFFLLFEELFLYRNPSAS